MDGNLSKFRRAFVDICNGYSVGQFPSGEKFYIKHLSHSDYLFLDDLQEQFNKEALEKGLLCEKDRLNQLYASKDWSEAKEKEIAQKRDFIKRLVESKKTILVPTILKRHEEDIQKEEKLLDELLIERAGLVGLTSEIHAAKMLNDYFILHNLFKDKELTKRFYSDEEFDDLSDAEISKIFELYNQATEACSEKNLRCLSVQPFFQKYFYLCEDNVHVFFGRPICEFSHYQLSLSNYAKYYKHILTNNQMHDLPESKRTDPDALEAYITTKSNAEQALKEGRAPVGMTNEDIKSLGLQGQISKAPNKEMNGMEFMNFLAQQKN